MGASSREELFIAVLDLSEVRQPACCTPLEGAGLHASLDAMALQKYEALQKTLCQALRQGFLSLAKARYSLGADRVSPMQFPAHLHATLRLVAAGGQAPALLLCPLHPPFGRALSSSSPSGSGNTWELVRVEPEEEEDAAAAHQPGDPPTDPARPTHSLGGGGVAAEPPSPEAAASGTAHQRKAVPGGNGDALEEQLAELRVQAEKSTSIMHDLAAKYCGGESDGRYLNGSRRGILRGVRTVPACLLHLLLASLAQRLLVVSSLSPCPMQLCRQR